MNSYVLGFSLHELCQLKALLDEDGMTMPQLLDGWRTSPGRVKARLGLIPLRIHALEREAVELAEHLK